MKKLLYLIVVILLPLFVPAQNKDRFNTASQAPPAGRIVDIFPNPSGGIFTVMFAKNNDIYTALVVYDNTGKQVYVKDHLNGPALRIDLGHLQPGIYYLVFMTADKNLRITEKMAIVK